jgi:multidrug/hemolysin transport system ATP-binding protein
MVLGERSVYSLQNVIEVKNLCKSYGDIRAVDGISFYVEEGKLFSFLGPNGAGKSTTIDILCTLLAPDQGVVTVNGFTLGAEDESIRRSIGVVFQDSCLDARLTVRENMTVRAGFYYRSREQIAQAVRNAAVAADVMGFIDRPYGRLSGGQRRRADIARALVHTPRILFLDEPTTGLDPQTRRNVWDTIRNLQEETGMTIFLTTHYMEEAAESDYVIIIDRGKIAAKGTPAELKAAYAEDVLRLYSKDGEALCAALAGEYAFTRMADQLILRIPDTLSALPIVERCRDYIYGFEVLRGSLDDAFIQITGKEIRE